MVSCWAPFPALQGLQAVRDFVLEPDLELEAGLGVEVELVLVPVSVAVLGSGLVLEFVH